MIKLFKKFFNYYISKDKHLARQAYYMLGLIPANLKRFKMAFYHKSSVSTSKETTYQQHPLSRSNERLEFLGDAILSSIVAEYLFLKYPDKNEGFLTQMRSKIVKRDSLNRIGQELGLRELLEQYNQNAKVSKAMMGNSLEALISVIYFELGYKRTKRLVINRILKRYLDLESLETYDDNYKSRLLEWAQKNHANVEFRTLNKYQQNKRDCFKVAVFLDGKKMGTADDFSKRKAEQLAAQSTLKRLGLVHPDRPDRRANGDLKNPQGDH